MPGLTIQSFPPLKNATAIRQFAIGVLPTIVWSKVFSQLSKQNDICTSICLGLTCRGMRYLQMKRMRFPWLMKNLQLRPTITSDCRGANSLPIRLGLLLKDWINIRDEDDYVFFCGWFEREHAMNSYESTGEFDTPINGIVSTSNDENVAPFTTPGQGHRKVWRFVPRSTLGTGCDEKIGRWNAQLTKKDDLVYICGHGYIASLRGYYS